MSEPLSNKSAEEVSVHFEGVCFRLNRAGLKKLKKAVADAERRLNELERKRFLERNLRLPFE